MDTIESSEPVGSDGATSSPDTSASDTQTAETGTPVSDGTPAEPASPEVKYAGKYTSPEELEKAYIEAQKLNGSLSQKAEIANLIEEQYGMTPEQFKAAIAREQEQKEQALYQENPGAYAVQKVTALEQQLAYKEEESKLNLYIAENPQYAPFKDKLFNLYLKVEKDKELGEIADEYFGAAIATGQKGAYNKIETKRNTQATPPSSMPKPKPDFSKMTSKEMEALLPHADVSNRPV